MELQISAADFVYTLLSAEFKWHHTFVRTSFLVLHKSRTYWKVKSLQEEEKYCALAPELEN